MGRKDGINGSMRFIKELGRVVVLGIRTPGGGRYVVGWMVAHRESAALANRLIQESCQKQGIVPGELTLHADRGSSMASKCVALPLADLGVTKTHSRPHVSNDNPFFESQFKTLKYRPEFPNRFGSIEDARAFCGDFFHRYNTEHRHSGIGWLTPVIPSALFASRPRRRNPPEAVWINPPEQTDSTQEMLVDFKRSCLIMLDNFPAVFVWRSLSGDSVR